ncbi:PREDICTED: ankyrin repeat-containing protein At3g12360-like isoform X2 [Prunus mume]|uniref:Ankyrin repeat-containing protein At3g12360-like isoform X2 n=1 Tax=Prunus mume TaxID=102107 RepID=A0ABM1LY14_PRUMU|nr:PREDICTED: ankyrin repeat-containing protein At3g12360-like isoform X2 [Prunus mume]
MMDASNSTNQTKSTIQLAQAGQADETNQEACLRSGMDLDVYKAAKEGNIDVLQRQQEHLHQILTSTKNTVLHIYIACAGSPSLIEPEKVAHKPSNIVEKILEMCPKLLWQSNGSGETALHIAARHGCSDIVAVLVKAAKARHGDLGQGVKEAWRCLIRKTNEGKDTALHEAARFNHLNVVEILTKEDTEFSYSANDSGDTPLYLAAERGYRDLVFKMLETCKYPTYGGPNEITRKILKHTKMALTKVVDGRGWTPLHFAALFGHTSIVKQLIESDKSAAYIGDNVYKKTPLHVAALQGHEQVMREIISHCPDCCELVDHKGCNALHYAIEWPRGLIEDLVLKDPWLSHVLLNGKDVDGNTPFHLLSVADNFIGDTRIDQMTFNKKNLDDLDNILADETLLPTLKNTVNRILEWNGVRPGGPYPIVSHEDSIGRNSKLYGDTIEEVKEDKGGILEMKDAIGYHSIDMSGENKGANDNDAAEEERQTSAAKEGRQTYLVVATLIATVTFTAGFTMPGGYQSEKGPDQGFAVLTRNAAFIAFVITNTLAMCMSSGSVFIHVLLQFLTKYKKMPADIAWGLYSMGSALVLMVIAFITGTYAVLGHSSALANAACVLGCLYFFAGYLPVLLLSKDERMKVYKFLKSVYPCLPIPGDIASFVSSQKSEKHSRESG